MSCQYSGLDVEGMQPQINDMERRLAFAGIADIVSGFSQKSPAANDLSHFEDSKMREAAAFFGSACTLPRFEDYKGSEKRRISKASEAAARMLATSNLVGSFAMSSLSRV